MPFLTTCLMRSALSSLCLAPPTIASPSQHPNTPTTDIASTTTATQKIFAHRKLKQHVFKLLKLLKLVKLAGGSDGLPVSK